MSDIWSLIAAEMVNIRAALRPLENGVWKNFVLDQWYDRLVQNLGRLQSGKNVEVEMPGSGPGSEPVIVRPDSAAEIREYFGYELRRLFGHVIYRHDDELFVRIRSYRTERYEEHWRDVVDTKKNLRGLQKKLLVKAGVSAVAAGEAPVLDKRQGGNLLKYWINESDDNHFFRDWDECDAVQNAVISAEDQLRDCVKAGSSLVDRELFEQYWPQLERMRRVALDAKMDFPFVEVIPMPKSLKLVLGRALDKVSALRCEGPER